MQIAQHRTPPAGGLLEILNNNTNVEITPITKYRKLLRKPVQPIMTNPSDIPITVILFQILRDFRFTPVVYCLK